MGVKHDATPATGTTLSSSPAVIVNGITLKAGSANASFILYHAPAGSPVAIFSCNALANTTFDKTFNQAGGNGGFNGIPLVGPVTYDLVGAGSEVTIEY